MDCGPEWLWPWDCKLYTAVDLWVNRFVNTDLLCRVSAIEAVFLYRTSWERSVEEAQRRNSSS